MDFESYLRSVLNSGIHLEEKFDVIYQNLTDIGVVKKEHLKYVSANDFGSTLTKIQARMLVEKFKCKYSFEWLFKNAEYLELVLLSLCL